MALVPPKPKEFDSASLMSAPSTRSVGTGISPIAGSANIENPDPAIGKIPVPSSRVDNADITLALSNSFGFGGTNATLALRKV